MARKSLISTALVSLMERCDQHSWTLEDLHSGLAEAGTVADFSSIYRAAERLVIEGAVLKLLLDDGRARFELAGPHHDHLHCHRCGQLVPVPCVIAAGDFAALEHATGAAIETHQLVLGGICRACRDRSRPERNAA